MPSSRRPGNRSGPRRMVPWIRNRLSWSRRPYAAGRRARPATVDQRARAGRGAHRRRGRLWLCHVLAGPPPPRSLALRVRDVEPRGGDALRGRALHPPPGAGRRARHARRSRVTPAPPDAPPPGAVCGDGVASVDALYACAAGGRRSGASVCGDSEEADHGVEGAAPRARRVERVGGTSGGVRPRPGRRRAEGPAARVSAGRACPCRRRRAARRASHAPHGRLSACSVGTIRQPVIVVCVFAMRRSSDIGMVTYIAMVTDIAMVACIAMVASIWRVASIGESGVSAGRVCPVCRGGGPPAAACRPGGSRHAPSPVRLARLVCGLPRRDHPSADHRRVRVRHAAIL